MTNWDTKRHNRVVLLLKSDEYEMLELYKKRHFEERDGTAIRRIVLKRLQEEFPSEWEKIIEKKTNTKEV